MDNLAIFPITATTDKNNLLIAGCNLRDLAATFGTPLYIYDEATIREICRQYHKEFESRFPNVRIFYAGKAWLSLALLNILIEEEINVDVVSGGELHIALSAGMPAERIAFNGNAKTAQELTQALDADVGCIIVDGSDELELLEQMTTERRKKQNIMLRITPNVDAYTYKKTTTGLKDSKFGFPILDNQAADAVARAVSAPHLNLTGFHVHLGSPIYSTTPYEQGIEIITSFAATVRELHNYEWQECCIGGGFAIDYDGSKTLPGLDAYAEAITRALRVSCERHNLPLPELHIEPGRSIVGRAGVALYTVVSTKHIPDVRDYIAVDGGMGDNIRPAMYGSHYQAVAPEHIGEAPAGKFTVVGKYCESGDILAQNAELPAMHTGDLIAVPASGAYHIPMESNYNLSLRPAIVMVCDGNATLIRRRQTFDDLLTLEQNLGV